MKREIDARRRVRISVRAGEGTLKGTYLFDAKGALLATEEGEAPGRGLSAFLSSQIREMPRVSGSEAREVLWEGERISLSILRYIHMTLGELTDLQAARIPDKEGIVDCGQRRRLTYRELKELSDALAVSLIRLGLKKGDKAAVIMDNCWQNLVTKAAIEKIGAVIVNLNIHEKGEMLITLLRDTDAKAVLIRQGIKSREHMELLFGMCPELMEQGPEEICCSLLPELKHVIVTDREKPRTCALQFEDLLEEGLQGDREILRQRKEEISPLDTVTIIHTSGSSGKPKGVLLTHAQLIESAWSHVEKMHLTPEDRFYMTSPMFHALGCIGSALASMTVGSTLVFHGFARCESLLSLLEQEQCTVFSSVPTVYLRLLELAQGEQWRGRLPLRLCITAGAPCPEKVFAGLAEVFGVREVLTMYGMTEAGPGITSVTIRPDTRPEDLAAGELWPGVEAQIRDVFTGRLLPSGEKGEICIRSFGVMQGYYKNPEETRRALDTDGWLHTGDMGYLSPEGRLFLTGRCKDLIIRGGENISPGEVEEFLRQNPQVEDAAVVGVPDPQYGEKVFAFVKAAQGEHICPAELAGWCRGKIATIKIPEFIVQLETFPETASGKVDKKELKKQAAGLCKMPGSKV